MPDISSIGQGSVGPVNRPEGPASSLRRPDTKEATDPPARPGILAELAVDARLLDQLRHLPDVRQDLVRTIRDAITQGTYETPQKLGEAIERLFAELRE